MLATVSGLLTTKFNKMTPKEQAEELIEKFMPSVKWDNKGYKCNESIICATICVDEIIKELLNCDCFNQVNWYKEVKEELSLL